MGRTRLGREAVAAATGAGRPIRWAAGCTAARRVPLGALAHLLPRLDTPATGALVRDAVAALAAGEPRRGPGSALPGESRAAGEPPRPVLGVDDVELLDELSLTVLHELAVTRAVSMLLVVNSDGAVPPPVVGLWKDGWAQRIEVTALARPEVDQLLDVVLGGAVHSGTGERLWRASRGHVSYLRELVEDAVADGTLACRDGLWRWDGPMRPSRRLAAIVHTRCGPLDPAEQVAVELLALGEPLAVGELARLAGDAVVERLERRGVLAVGHSGSHSEARLAHPIYGEVFRAELPYTAAAGLRRRLLEEWSRAWSSSAPAARARWEPEVGDLLRTGRLLAGFDPADHTACHPLEPSVDTAADRPGVDRDPQVLSEVAGAANAVGVHDLAEQLARRALDEARRGGPGPAAGADSAAGVAVRARAALVEAMRWQGRVDEAEQIATAACARSGPAGHLRTAHAAAGRPQPGPRTADRTTPASARRTDQLVAGPPGGEGRSDVSDARLAIGRALNVFFGLGRRAEAEALLEAARARTTGSESTRVAATQAVLAYFAGRPDEAARLGDQIAIDGGDELARAWAAAAAALGHGITGRAEASLRAVAAGRVALEGRRRDPELAMIGRLLAHAEVSTLLWVGRIGEAECRAVEAHRRQLAGPGCGADPFPAAHRGSCALAQGRVDTAVRWLGEAVAGLAPHDPAGAGPACTGALAAAHAQRGDTDAAVTLLSTARAGEHPAVAVFAPGIRLAEAWAGGRGPAR